MAEQSNIKPGDIEFHLLPYGDKPSEVVKAKGYLKFGPQFVAVVDGPEDQSNVETAVPTHLIQYVKRIGEEGNIEATLAP